MYISPCIHVLHVFHYICIFETTCIYSYGGGGVEALGGKRERYWGALGVYSLGKLFVGWKKKYTADIALQKSCDMIRSCV